MSRRRRHQAPEPSCVGVVRPTSLLRSARSATTTRLSGALDNGEGLSGLTFDVRDARCNHMLRRASLDPALDDDPCCASMGGRHPGFQVHLGGSPPGPPPRVESSVGRNYILHSAKNTAQPPTACMSRNHIQIHNATSRRSLHPCSPSHQIPAGFVGCTNGRWWLIPR